MDNKQVVQEMVSK